MSINEAAARAFAAQFNPPLRVCKTDRVNNLPMADAWVVSYHDASRGIGITTVAYAGGIHAFIEAAGAAEIAEDAGRVMATALGLFKRENEAGHDNGGTS